MVFLRQFLSPLIYILLAAAVVSTALSDLKDAAFIGAVLLLNGIIGGIQEYSAGQSTTALRNLESPRATVLRDGERQDIDARELVPGDVVLLEAGSRVVADLRLDRAEGLRCDEALLTGSCARCRKEAGTDATAVSVAFAGTLVVRGRGCGVVTATGGGDRDRPHRRGDRRALDLAAAADDPDATLLAHHRDLGGRGRGVARRGRFSARHGPPTTSS